MKSEIMNKIGRVAGNASLSLKKHSPEILMVTGLVSVAAGTVLACKATIKAQDILEEHKNIKESIHEVKAMSDDESNTQVTDYTETDYKQDLTKAYFKTAIKMAKVYAPAAFLGTFGIMSILASNNILRKRNVALAAAYSAIDKSFKEYRSRVVERFGETVDKELKYGIKAQEIEEVVTDDNGKEKTVKKKVAIAEGVSDYAVFFDKFSSQCCKREEDYNNFFLSAQERYANDRLRARGWITLNEVIQDLGITDISDELRNAGLVVGWRYDKNNEIGDNEVKFIVTETTRELDDGTKVPTKIIDFNVDGSIYDLL